MVRMAFTMSSYSQADLMMSQSPKILSLDLPKQRLLLPPVQEATAKSQTLHSDRALPTTTILRLKMIVRPSETDIPKMDKELKEKERNVTQNPAQPRNAEVSRMIAIYGPMPDNRETQAMTITTVRIKRMEIGSLTETERVGVSIECREDLRATGETLMPTLTEVMHRGVLDL